MSEETCNVAVTLWYLKVRKASGSKKNLNASQEMAQMSDGTNGENIIYREVVLNKHNQKSKEPKAEETTYTEIKKASQRDDTLIYTEINLNAKRRAKNLPQDTDPDPTYAEIKLMSEKSESGDVSKDLYACVNKKKPTTAQES
ncbi:uncharacterized protein LOC143815589 isoform X2 [Ranitomeya variabilis]|uniref:uncharacterized protein LOC143815589 isoform X2 n=1 Tax=Ranitomeya variabilis TaxID=490064 RepID=UPI0040568BCC